MSVSARENLLALLDRKAPAWIPFTFDVGAMPGLTAPVLREFHERTGADDPAEHFDFDWRTFSLKAVFGGEDPRRYHPDAAPGVTFDEWGIGHLSAGLEATVDRTFPPLAHTSSVAEIEAYPSPVIDTTVNLERIAEFQRRGYAVFGYAGSVYEWSWWLRGMEAFLPGMLDQPAITEAILTKVADYTRRLALASAEAGIDVLCFYDDAGMQTGMQISPAMWRRHIKPRWAGVLEAVRSRYPHVRTFLHSCGNIRSIVPDIVELGFDVLHPIQPECMDFAEIRREFGRHVTLCATVGAQRLLPFGTPADVRAEVRRLKTLCQDDRRCILCPSNLIQPETPWDNIVAFAEEARAGR